MLHVITKGVPSHMMNKVMYVCKNPDISKIYL